MNKPLTHRRWVAFILSGLMLPTLIAWQVRADADTLGGSAPQLPGTVQHVADLLSTPVQASLSAVDTMLGNTNHVIASVADQWVQNDKAPAAVANAEPEAATESASEEAAATPAEPIAAEEPAAPVVAAQAAAEAKTAAAHAEDPAAAVFAGNAPQAVVAEPPEEAKAIPAEPVAPAAKPATVVVSSPDPVYIVHHENAGALPQPTHYAQLVPAAGEPEAPAAAPAEEPAPAATPAQADAPAQPAKPPFEATVTEAPVPAGDPAAAPSPLMPSETPAEPALNPAIQRTLSHIPSNMGTPPAGPTEHLRVDHQTKPREEKNKKSAKAPKKPIVDASVETGKPAFDAQYELQQGYGALSAGNTEAAISIYTSVLNNDPDNKQALFGIASAYHRVGQTDKARPYYSRLLKIDPTNRSALNNFMALAAEEAPQEALRELQELQERNPDFSPIPAQIAYVCEKLGQSDQAIENMQHAVGMEPENLTYRYNLAVMYDKAGRGPEAMELYKQIVDASNRGERVPGSLERVQERLMYLSANAPK